jgi:hypothetical protein
MSVCYAYCRTCWRQVAQATYSLDQWHEAIRELKTAADLHVEQNPEHQVTYLRSENTGSRFGREAWEED